MNPRFETARFHVDSGPESLFERVCAKMAGKRTLKFHASHFIVRAEERTAPIEQIRQFDTNEWELKTVEVRTDNFSWRGEPRQKAVSN